MTTPTDHDRLVALAIRQEQHDIDLAALKVSITEQTLRQRSEAVLCPFSPEKGSNGNSVIKRVEKIETRFAQIYWLLVGIAAGTGVTLFKEWWPMVAPLIK